MKRIILALTICGAFTLSVVLTVVNAQSVTSAPVAIMMVSSNGNPPYAPLTLALGSGLSVSSAPFIVPMCSASGNAPYTPCNFGTSAYNPAAVAITGGTIDGTTIGGTTPAAITGTTIASKPASANQGLSVFGAGADSALTATLTDNGSADFFLQTSNATLQLLAGGSGNLIMDSSTSGAVFIAQQKAAPVNIAISTQTTTVAGPLVLGATKFTATGCTSITATVGNGTAGKFTIGANSCTVVITMNGATGMTAANGWSCSANDETTAAGQTGLRESASNATTATLSVPSTAVANDVIDFACRPF